VLYDLRPPEPLFDTRPLSCSAGVAFVLTAERSERSLAQIEISAADVDENIMADPALETLRLGNPAGRTLPLLRLLALEQAGEIGLRGTGHQRWRLRVKTL
jgi:hypothetical protein